MCPDSVLTHMRRSSLPEVALSRPRGGSRSQDYDATSSTRARRNRGAAKPSERGPHVDDKLELGRLLNGQLGRTCALHDPPYIDASCGSAGASRGRAGPPAKICTMPAANPTSTPIFQASP